MIATIYRDSIAQGMSPRRAVSRIARELGIPSASVRRQLGIR